MGLERKERSFVNLADPLAGQAKLFANLAPSVVIEVNSKKNPLLPFVEKLSGEVAQLECSLQLKVFGFRVAPVARYYFEDGSLNLTVWPVPFNIP